MLLRLIPLETDLKFLKFRYIAFAVSSAAMVASVLLVLTMGLNFGIDFRGGTVIEIQTPEAADLGEIRNVVGDLGIGNVAVQEFGAPTDVLIRIETQEADPADIANEDITEARAVELAQQRALSRTLETLEASIAGVEIRRTEVVGPKVSGELVQNSIIAVLIAVGAMLIYIWFRFEWQFSLGAVLALVHDVVLTLGVFALTQLDFTLSIIAALLTIVGYSMNDTVVVYDRVREKLRKYKKMPLPDLLDFAINKTLSRTVLTSLTTLLALGSLFVLGGENLRGFTFAMIWGVVIGTYSSIFIAAPLLTVLGVKRDWSGVQTKAAGVHVGG